MGVKPYKSYVKAKIINLISENKFITNAELSDKISISSTAIEKYYCKLKVRALFGALVQIKAGIEKLMNIKASKQWRQTPLYHARESEFLYA